MSSPGNPHQNREPDPLERSESGRNGGPPETPDRPDNDVLPRQAETRKLDGPGEASGRADMEIDLERQTIGEALARLGYWMQYSASIPERTLRSASALAGGVVREGANWLIPAAFRNSKSYSIFVQQMLDFLAHEVGGVARRQVAEGKEAPPQIDVARKAVGNFLDLAALATLHVSPITVLAVFSDVAYGSKYYLLQLSTRLKQQGIIAEDTTIDRAADLIDALEKVSGDTTELFDQPPVSVEGLRKTLAETQQAIARIDPQQLLPKAEIDQLWRQMELAATAENASLWDVSAAMAVVALRNAQAAGRGALTSLELSGDLFQEHIVQHYWEGLREIERHGLLTTLSKTAGPYLEAVWKNFSSSRKTWTEKLLSGEFFKQGWERWTRSRSTNH